MSNEAVNKKGAPPEGKYADGGNGVQIHYITKGEGPAVVFVHGSGPGASGWSNFKQNIDAVADAGFQAIVVDLIGFGYSSKPTDMGDYTLDLFATTLTNALKDIGVQQCALVGNSLGGAVSIRIALDQPEFVSKLILMAPGGIETTEDYFAMPGISRMVSEFVGGVLDYERLGELLKMLVFDPKHVTDALVTERLAVLETQPAEVLSTMKVPNQDEELGELQCPILGFWGTDDLFCPTSGVQKILDACRPARFTIVNECGHWVMVEHANMFNVACVDFLKNG